jgi:phosphoserine phosphatase
MSEGVQGIVGFDLDGTLLRGPTACEVIAEPLGRLEQMKYFETMKTEQEIVSARTEMARWYDGRAFADLQCFCERACWAPGAWEAVALLQSRGIEVVIASITWSFAVAWFAKRLNIRRYLGTQLLPNGDIVHVWDHDKGRWFRDLVQDYGVPDSLVAAVGDSQGDAEFLRVAALRFFVGSGPVPNIPPPVVHIPNADLRVVAEHIVREWEV